jgi:hypothetical protein
MRCGVHPCYVAAWILIRVSIVSAAMCCAQYGCHIGVKSCPTLLGNDPIHNFMVRLGPAALRCNLSSVSCWFA